MDAYHIGQRGTSFQLSSVLNGIFKPVLVLCTLSTILERAWNAHEGMIRQLSRANTGLLKGQKPNKLYLSSEIEISSHSPILYRISIACNYLVVSVDLANVNSTHYAQSSCSQLNLLALIFVRQVETGKVTCLL